jgi:hypothetical protein
MIATGRSADSDAGDTPKGDKDMAVLSLLILLDDLVAGGYFLVLAWDSMEQTADYMRVDQNM